MMNYWLGALFLLLFTSPITAQLLGLEHYNPNASQQTFLSMSGYFRLQDDFHLQEIPSIKNDVKTITMGDNDKQYFFDERGRVRQVIETDWTGTLETFFTYHQNETISEVKQVSNAYEMEITEVYSYENGWLASKRVESEAYDGDLNVSVNYIYNEEKDSVWVDFEYENNDPSIDRKVAHYYRFELDERGRLVREHKFGTDGEYNFGHNEDYQYDEQGRVVAINHFSICATANSCSMLSYSFVYDNPDAVLVDLYDATIRNSMWSDSGQQLYYYEDVHTYVYDDKGNWVKRIGKDGEIVERVIEYYN